MNNPIADPYTWILNDDGTVCARKVMTVAHRMASRIGRLEIANAHRYGTALHPYARLIQEALGLAWSDAKAARRNVLRSIAAAEIRTLSPRAPGEFRRDISRIPESVLDLGIQLNPQLVGGEYHDRLHRICNQGGPGNDNSGIPAF